MILHAFFPFLYVEIVPAYMEGDSIGFIEITESIELLM